MFHEWYFSKILVRLLNGGERYIGHAKRTRGVINFYRFFIAMPEGKRSHIFVYWHGPVAIVEKKVIKCQFP